jgi:rhamnosyl/mannosyltransferase
LAEPCDRRYLAVLHVYKDVYPPIAGGVENHVELLRRMMPRAEGHALSCSRSQRLVVAARSYGIDVLVPEFGRPLSNPVAPGFLPWIARMRPDIVHLHMPFPTGEVAVLASRWSAPVVASYHADVAGRQARMVRLYRPLVRSVVRRAAAVVVGTEALARGSELVGDLGEDVSVVPYGVDVDVFNRSRVDPNAVRTLRERYGSRVVVATGRLVHYKGLDVLIDAAADLDATVCIIGTGPLEESLRARAAGNPRVVLLGSVPRETLLLHLAAADVYALASTSRAESFGIATVEAQAMGLPAVVTDVGTGTTEALDPGRSGLVVPPNDPQALVRALRRILDDADLRARWGAAARARALRRHAADGMVERIRGIYDDALRSRPRAA